MAIVRSAAFKNVLLGLVLMGSATSQSILHARQEAAPAAQAVPIALAELPAQGRQTYRLVFQGGPFPNEKDGAVFGNRERQLPLQGRGFYREYTVRTPGDRSRGARRIVCGGPAVAPEACYYTSDHYTSFRRIVDR